MEPKSHGNENAEPDIENVKKLGRGPIVEILLNYVRTFGSYLTEGTWGGVVVKALPYYSEISGSIPGGVTGDFFRRYLQNHVPWGRLSL
jgi:hypothetical protein